MTDQIKPGWYKDLEGKIPAKPGDRVALIVPNHGPSAIQKSEKIKPFSIKIPTDAAWHPDATVLSQGVRSGKQGYFVDISRKDCWFEDEACTIPTDNPEKVRYIKPVEGDGVVGPIGGVTQGADGKFSVPVEQFKLRPRPQ